MQATRSVSLTLITSAKLVQLQCTSDCEDLCATAEAKAVSTEQEPTEQEPAPDGDVPDEDRGPEREEGSPAEDDNDAEPGRQVVQPFHEPSRSTYIFCCANVKHMYMLASSQMHCLELSTPVGNALLQCKSMQTRSCYGVQACC